jgi:hypothetical protein
VAIDIHPTDGVVSPRNDMRVVFSLVPVAAHGRRRGKAEDAVPSIRVIAMGCMKQVRMGGGFWLSLVQTPWCACVCACACACVCVCVCVCAVLLYLSTPLPPCPLVKIQIHAQRSPRRGSPSSTVRSHLEEKYVDPSLATPNLEWAFAGVLIG